MTPKMGVNEGRHEFNVGLVGGFTPQFRVFKNVSVFADFSLTLTLDNISIDVHTLSQITTLQVVCIQPH
jgi:hypothetical protein